MTKRARRPAMAAALVALVVLLVAASGASATVGCERALRGEGSSLQLVSQETGWIPGWRGLCSGAEITYSPTGSGAGLRAWHAEGRVEGGVATSGDHFIGTDDAPNETQVAAIRGSAHEVGIGIIPVEQA